VVFFAKWGIFGTHFGWTINAQGVAFPMSTYTSLD